MVMGALRWDQYNFKHQTKSKEHWISSQALPCRTQCVPARRLTSRRRNGVRTVTWRTRTTEYTNQYQRANHHCLALALSHELMGLGPFCFSPRGQERWDGVVCRRRHHHRRCRVDHPRVVLWYASLV